MRSVDSRRRERHSRPGARAAAALLVLGIFVGPGASGAQEGSVEQDNARLEAENARLREELEALRGEASSASGEAGVAAAEAAAPASAGGSTEVEAAFVPMSRVSLTVSRDAAGGIQAISTPWQRTADGGPLPVRDFIQFRARPAKGKDPAQVWLNLNRQAAPSPLVGEESARLQIGTWTAQAPIVQHDTDRQRRRFRQGSMLPPVSELIVFALPPGTLEKLATAKDARFQIDPVAFAFTDEHVAAAAALAARLAKPEEGDR